ncbi:hypothetical protein Gotri_012404 [Gossypium trilobum]|uniref:HAT C-terminal dimerisation domain-containing protein n=1 Tax=Gossypium trilobum TaxID=34281 RepID=A0A7J9DR42_9ROSI|nr:hypothetical protein [Gossypium trilobum]
MASSKTPIHVDDGFNEYESVSKRQKSTTSKVATQPSLRGDLPIKSYKFDADECRRAVSTFLGCGKHSFRTIEESGFRYMMSVAKLAKALGLICLTYDNWSSKHTNDECICITAHWVDKDWKLQKRIIRFRALSSPYDGLNIADEPLLRDGAFFQVRCCAHILNLIVKASLELNDDVTGKIRNGIKYIKKSGIRRKKIYDGADKSFHVNVTKKLRQDVCERWNSTYLMLEFTLYYKDVLDYWGQRDKDYLIFSLYDEEWRNVAILCNFFKVFYDVTCVFSGSKYPMVNLYFRGVWEFHNVLIDTIKGPHSFLTLMYCFTTIYYAHASDFVQTILNNLKLLFDEYVKNSKSTSSSLTGSSNVLDNNPIDSSLHQLKVNSVDLREDYDESDDYKQYLSESSTKSENSQLDIYLEEPELKLNSQIDVLNYWSKSSIRYRELSFLAHDLLVIPISTVSSKSAFSMEKKVITSLRSSLKPKMVQAIV